MDGIGIDRGDAGIGDPLDVALPELVLEQPLESPTPPSPMWPTQGSEVM